MIPVRHYLVLTREHPTRRTHAAPVDEVYVEQDRYIINVMSPSFLECPARCDAPIWIEATYHGEVNAWCSACDALVCDAVSLDPATW